MKKMSETGPRAVLDYVQEQEDLFWHGQVMHVEAVERAVGYPTLWTPACLGWRVPFGEDLRRVKARGVVIWTGRGPGWVPSFIYLIKAMREEALKVGQQFNLLSMVPVRSNLVSAKNIGCPFSDRVLDEAGYEGVRVRSGPEMT